MFSFFAARKALSFALLRKTFFFAPVQRHGGTTIVGLRQLRAGAWAGALGTRRSRTFGAPRLLVWTACALRARSITRAAPGRGARLVAARSATARLLIAPLLGLAARPVIGLGRGTCTLGRLETGNALLLDFAVDQLLDVVQQRAVVRADQ